MVDIQEIRNKYRFHGIALFDLVLSFVGVILLFIFCWKKHFPTLNGWRFIIAGFLLTIPLSIFSHIVVGTNTTLNYRLGLSYEPSK